MFSNNFTKRSQNGVSARYEYNSYNSLYQYKLSHTPRMQTELNFQFAKPVVLCADINGILM